MKGAIFIVLSTLSFSGQLVLADDQDKSDEIGSKACAIHVEGDFEFKKKMSDFDCKKGDALLLFNEAKTRRWQSLIPIRAAAVVACDMSKPITDSQHQGLQYVMCTFNGSHRELQIDKKYTKGWTSFF